MRTEPELRRHLAALKKLVDKPCDCRKAGQPHSMRCQIGGSLMKAAIQQLEWVLGDDTHAATFFDRLTAAGEEL